MPLISIKSSITTQDSSAIDSLLTTLSAKLAEHLSKPESYIMTAFEPDIKMTFAGTFDPVCYVEIKSIGNMKPEQTKAMSQDFCDIIETKLGVSKQRVYIEFADAERTMWGWNGSTF